MDTTNLGNEQIVISNQALFEQKRKLLMCGGSQSLQIVSDFDHTLTVSKIDGQRSWTSFSILERPNFLSEAYLKGTQELYNQYHPIEYDPKIPDQEKRPKMEEWWRKTNELLVHEKFNINRLPQLFLNAKLAWRRGCRELFEFLHQNDIPLLILSAGIGPIIEEYIKRTIGQIYPNIHVISNEWVTDKEGFVIDYEDPLIHTLNKNEAILLHSKNTKWFESVQKRKNIILLGDNLSDAHMADCYQDPNVILKIGFLNHRFEELPHYKEVFDAIILNDGTLEWVNNLVQQICKGC